MQKVITINLNGRAYQLDESGFETLRAYLTLAETKLKDNPDRAEILADFEQAIGERCGKFLGAHKTVITAAEMDQVLAEMGPVEGPEPPGTGADRTDTDHDDADVHMKWQRRLYRIREGQVIAGVCTGLAAYFGIDVTIVRILFLLLTIFTFGWALLAYWALVFIVPEAQTSDERAAAHGQRPFNAQELIDQARKTAADFKATAGFTQREWKRQWREQRRQWRAQHRAWQQQWRERVVDARAWRPWTVPPPGYAVPPWAGYLMPIFSLASLAFFVALILAITSLVNTGALWGWPLPTGVPLWAGILILIVFFQLVTAPLRAARHASYYAWGYPSAWFAAWDGLVATGMTMLFIWLLYTHMPPTHDLREFMQNLPVAFRNLMQEFSMWIRDLAAQFK